MTTPREKIVLQIRKFKRNMEIQIMLFRKWLTYMSVHENNCLKSSPIEISKLKFILKKHAIPQTFSGLSMNILRPGGSSSVQEPFFKNSAGDFLPALKGFWTGCVIFVILKLYFL